MQLEGSRISPADGGNSSGQGSSAVIPDEIHGWNWGAFLFSWIWAIGNNRIDMAVYGFAAFVLSFSLGMPGWFAQLIIGIILGAKGTEWAWRSKKWRSIEHFKRTQKKWARWGIAAFALNFLLVLWAGITEFGVWRI